VGWSLAGDPGNEKRCIWCGGHVQDSAVRFNRIDYGLVPGEASRDFSGLRSQCRARDLRPCDVPQ
jgi:hypothetical protein